MRHICGILRKYRRPFCPCHVDGPPDGCLRLSPVAAQVELSSVFISLAAAMVLVLVIGDLHIPHRIHDLPLKFKKLLVPGKIQQILCTGNVCDRETYEYLRTVSPDVHVVRGDYDEVSRLTNIEMPYHDGASRKSSFPLSVTVAHSPIRIGVVHGHQCVPTGDLDTLNAIARQLDVDVLVSGHTHT